MSISKVYWRVVVIIFFIAASGLIIYRASILLTSLPDEWLIGDWLINYQGGLVRRGLIGEVFFRISQLSGLENIVALVVGFQVLVYLVFFINTCRLAMHGFFSATTAAILFSPAFVLFPILDKDGAFRKEILLFAVLSGLCCHLAFSKRSVSRNLPLLIGGICALIVLSHEMLVVYLPYVICAFIIFEKGFGIHAKKAVAAMVPAIMIAVSLSIFSQGETQAVSAICSSLGARAPQDCIDAELPGAISFLRKDVSDAHTYVLSAIGGKTLWLYGLTGTLSFAPLVLMVFSSQFAVVQKNTEMRRWLTLFIGSALLGSLPLLWVVADYGRLIYIHITCLSLLALMATQEQNSHDTPLYLNSRQLAAWTLVLLFMGSWRMMHWKASIHSTFRLVELMFDFLFNR